MSAHAGSPAPGEMIGPYRVDRRIGSGAMGVVYAARDAGLDREVALKVISPHLADDQEFRARFTREARAQASLDSAHVVHVYAHGEVDGRLYIATQLVPGGDLGAMVRAHGAPPLPVAVDLVGQVASGLADAHAARLVHRDIKPANVLLRPGERVRAYLADFGIAREVGGEDTRGRAGAIGTPSYMAPELHTGGTAGVASDIYSLGCLLWATLSGRAPYGGTSDFEIVTAHRERPVPQLAGRGPQGDAVNRVLRSAMAKQPEDRYPTAAAMRDDLLAAARLSASLVPARRRARLPVVVAGAVVLVTVLAGAAYALTRGGEDEPTSGSPPPSSPSSSSPSSSAPGGADEKRAATAFADALVEQGAMTRGQATCVAGRVVGDLGLEQLVEDGFFDEDLSFLDPDLSDDPEIKQALTKASFDCVL